MKFMEQEILTRQVFRKYYKEILLNEVFKEEVCKNEYADSLINYFLGENEDYQESIKTINIIKDKYRINPFLFKDIMNKMNYDAYKVKEAELNNLYN